MIEKNINEQLLPLAKVFNKSYRIETKEECLQYIDEIHQAFKEITELHTFKDVQCYKCVHYDICKLLFDLPKHRLDYFIVRQEIAWVCRHFKKEEEEGE